MSKLTLVFLTVGLSLVLPPLEAAAERDRPATERTGARFELGLSLGGDVSLDGGRCAREESDVVGCTGLAYGMLQSQLACD